MRALNVRAPAAVATLLLLAVARPALARERLAVLIVADADPALADDLTEVAIATLAERRDRELVGLRELRGRLAGVVPEAGLGACLSRPDCLAQVGAAAGAARAVIGSLRPSGGGRVLELALMDTRTAETQARVSAVVPAGIDRLMAAVREGVTQLFVPRMAEVRPAPAHPAGVPPLASRQADSARPHAWVPYAGVAATALAAISFSAAAVTGTIAMEDPVGSTRAIAQSDLDRRNGYATTANGLLVAGAVLSAAAGAAFIWWWREARGH